MAPETATGSGAQAPGGVGIPRVTRPELVVLAALTAAFAAMLTLWAFLTPIYGAPDEHAHLNSAIRLTQGLTWPAPGDARLSEAVVAARDEAALAGRDRSTFSELMADHPGDGGVDQMTQHPPLYYLLAAGALQAVGYEQLRADVALLSLRLGGVLLMLPLPSLLWDAARRMTGSSKAGILAAASIFLVPQLGQIAGAVSNDGLTILLCSVVGWLCVRVMTGDDRRRTVVAVGISLGVALLAKGTSLPFIPFVAAVLLVWPRGVRIRTRVIRSVTALAIAFALGGWWWLRNLLIYGDLQPSGLAGIRQTVPWEPGTGPDLVSYLDVMWIRVTTSFWGDFGLLDYALPDFLTDLLSIVSLAMIVVYFLVRDRDKLRMAVLMSLPTLLVLMLIVNTWRHYVRTQLFAGMQGRYLFVAILILVVMSAVAWRRLIPAAHRRHVGTGLLIAFVLVAAVGLFRAYAGAYEADFYRLTRDGLSQWALLSPGGISGVVISSLLMAVLMVGAVIVTLRFIRSDAAADSQRESGSR